MITNPTAWLCAFLLTASAAWGAPLRPILVDVDEANPPFMYGTQNNALGIYPRLIEAAFRHMKVPVQVEAKPWKRALAELEDGTAGVGGIYKNAERIRKFDYSGQLFIERLIVYFSSDQPMDFRGVEDLKGRRIGVLRGWSYGDDFDDLRRRGECTVEEVSSDDQNFQKLSSGRLDAVIAIHEAGSRRIAAYRNVTFAATPLALNPTFLAFSKAANRSLLLKQFDAALKEMARSGEFQRIVAEDLAR